MFYKEFMSFVLLLLLPISKGAIPGTFFWRPRLGIDMALHTSESPISVYKPNKQNIEAGLVVLLNGYDVVGSILGLLRGAEFAADEKAMDPAFSPYYSNVYKWAWRTLDLLPHWVRGNFNDGLRGWNNRFKYMDVEMPAWLQKAFPWVPKESWDTEHEDMVKFRKFAETAFIPFYRFPSKVYNDFNSFLPASLDSFLFSSTSRDDFDMSAEQEKDRKSRERKLKLQFEKKAEKPPTITTEPGNTTTTEPTEPGDTTPED
ncbi:uncharacterized protein LOC134679345 [Cydia fagiglandana]|uniref:uncharacterized protein LOC134679345 n=1 Tax=Cydia fagiglandana TaxID=1458189 RepID=UPI002FEDF21F